MFFPNQDAFGDNFVVQWFPESLLVGKPPTHRPRVFLIDFEMAIQFPIESEPEDCICQTLPIPASYPPTRYERPFPFYKEPVVGEPFAYEIIPYNAFELDTWQTRNAFATLSLDPEVITSICLLTLVSDQF
jgi:hypothetical protein